jgi:3-hydroxy-9,10-secoandrosta-1,3,5(10)-triene-9,17-dione monooxygenase
MTDGRRNADVANGTHAALTVLTEEDAPSEALGRLSRRAWEALESLGAFGGLLTNPLPNGVTGALQQVRRIAAASGSAGWISAVGFGGVSSVTALPTMGQEEIWADGTAGLVCGTFARAGTARRTDSGVHVSARVNMVSGAAQAAWFMVVVSEETTDVPRELFVIIPAAEMRITSTWDAPGLIATGSDTVEVSDVFVPDRRTVPMEQLAAHGLTELRLSPGLLSTLALAAPMVGLGRAALDAAFEHLVDDAGALTARSARRDVREAVTNCALATDRAEALFEAAVNDLSDAPLGGLTPLARSRVLALATAASQEAATAASSVLGAVSPTTLKPGSRTNRIWRDVQTGIRHMSLVPARAAHAYEDALFTNRAAAELHVVRQHGRIGWLNR